MFFQYQRLYRKDPNYASLVNRNQVLKTACVTAADMKQISIWLANKSGNDIRNNDLFKVSSQCAGITQTR